jgi:transcriptional regulator with XRE-family HTH domain
MARAAIGWTTRQLGRAARVGEATVHRFERGDVATNHRTVEALCAALEDAGVVFIPENGGGAGVRMRDREPPASTKEPGQ